jgi:hypothetical protein
MPPVKSSPSSITMIKREYGILLLGLLTVLMAILYGSYYASIGGRVSPVPTQAVVYSKPTHQP